MSGGFGGHRGGTSGGFGGHRGRGTNGRGWDIISSTPGSLSEILVKSIPSH